MIARHDEKTFVGRAKVLSGGDTGYRLAVWQRSTTYWGAWLCTANSWTSSGRAWTRPAPVHRLEPSSVCKSNCKTTSLTGAGKKTWFEFKHGYTVKLLINVPGVYKNIASTPSPGIPGIPYVNVIVFCYYRKETALQGGLVRGKAPNLDHLSKLCHKSIILSF